MPGLGPVVAVLFEGLRSGIGFQDYVLQGDRSGNLLQLGEPQPPILVSRVPPKRCTLPSLR